MPLCRHVGTAASHIGGCCNGRGARTNCEHGGDRETGTLSPEARRAGGMDSARLWISKCNGHRVAELRQGSGVVWSSKLRNGIGATSIADHNPDFAWLNTIPQARLRLGASQAIGIACMPPLSWGDLFHRPLFNEPRKGQCGRIRAVATFKSTRQPLTLSCALAIYSPNHLPGIRWTADWATGITPLPPCHASTNL